MSILWKLFEHLYSQADNENRKAILRLCQKGTRLLDLGCGDGEFTLKLANRIGAKEVCGIEIVPTIADKASAKGVKVHQYDLNPYHINKQSS
jgi:ubiquinone/menaquinone biosynthesis C-methylase UbiE